MAGERKKQHRQQKGKEKLVKYMTEKIFKTKIFSCILAAVMIISLSACGDTGSRQNTPASDAQNSTQDNSQSSAQADIQADAQENDQTAENSDSTATEIDSGILIAYFTAAENSGVDAVSSASYTTINGEAVGRVQAVADMIQEQTGGELFSIQTSTIYPADGGALIDQAADEQDDGFRPELISHIENLDDYDVIFVGYPNWWYDMPMAMYSFFEEYDFSGKTIIPFNVHNGSRFSSTISTIQSLEPNAAVVEDGFLFSRFGVGVFCKNTAYAGCILGVRVHESSLGAALEHDSGYSSKVHSKAI